MGDASQYQNSEYGARFLENHGYIYSRSNGMCCCYSLFDVLLLFLDDTIRLLFDVVALMSLL